MHRFSRQRLTEQELHDALLLIAAAFVVLPLLPNRAIDPWGALNLRRLWILVVAVMGVSSASYIALRAFGSRFGLAVTGLAGGFISGTATIAAMGGQGQRTTCLCRCQFTDEMRDGSASGGRAYAFRVIPGIAVMVVTFYIATLL